MTFDLLRRSGDLRGIADVKLVVLEDGPGRGQRLLIGRNARGIAFEIAVDRGFDICGLSFKGDNIGWHSPVRMAFPAHAPGSEDGWGFLRNFDGFMVTCGLDHYSRPREASVDHYNHPHLTTKNMPLHGRISSEKALLQGSRVDEDAMAIVCEGVVTQVSVFGEHLELRRKITVPVFEAQVTVEDTVINRAFRPTDHAFMYHLNVGYPFLDESLAISGLPEPLSSQINAVPFRPADDFGEKVDVVDSRITAHDGVVRLCNRQWGVELSLTYSQDTLPKLGIWRAFQSGVFALGIEPRTDLASQGAAQLQPRETRRYGYVIRFCDKPVL